MAFSNGFESSDNSTRSRDSFGSNQPSLYSFAEEPSSTASMSRPSSFGLSQPSSTYTDARGQLQRRFTTSNASNLLGSLSPIGQQRRQAAEFSPPDLSFAIKSQQGQRADRKSAEREYLRQKQQEFENAQNEIHLLELQIQQRKDALRREQADFLTPSAGHQSEPTTPPEYRDPGFPTALSRPNRFSASNMASPPGIINRPSRAGSQALSPPSSERARAYQALTGQSLPQTRDNSDEDENAVEEPWERKHRSAASLNRNSMPVAGRNGFADLASAFGPVNTTAFLFDDEHERATTSASNSNRSSFVRNGLLQANTNEDKFPILLRRSTDAKMPPHSSSGIEEGSNASATTSSVPAKRSRPLSYSQGVVLGPRSNGNNMSANDSPTYRPAQPVTSSGNTTPNRLNRHSMGPRVGTYPENVQRPPLVSSPSSSDGTRSTATPRLQSSYSTNDIPTVNNSASVQATATPEERLHHHNASLGRIPSGAVRSNRTSRDLNELTKSPDLRNEELETPSIQSILQAGAGSGLFNNNAAQAPSNNATGMPSAFSQPAFPGANAAGLYGAYPQQQNGLGGNLNGALQALTSGMSQMSMMSGNGQWPNHMPQAMYGQQAYANYPPFQQPYGQHRSGMQRRGPGEDQSRFHNMPLETMQGEIYGLCRDQHGCRYLQKKLEEGRAEQTNMIFGEVNPHMFELMTDPFGNYLVQKLLEQCTEAQRTTLIDNAAPHMIHIALNQHGTRALQKMIDFVSTPPQINRVIESLQPNVVGLIQDLNGNHVIQKCLNRLSAVDAQFIFDSVAHDCVRVGTHRHGCCVIQRCIDHAEGPQKARLVLSIVERAPQLVGDPFGNYVLQYIFEQGEETFSRPLCLQFKGSMTDHSKQKFSSNVVEKALRVADAQTKQELIHELIYSPGFESVADDAFGNYVLQTAWDYASGDDEHALAAKIRPLLARGMRSKPHGRRFATRLADYDSRHGNSEATATTGSTPAASSLTSPNLPHMSMVGQAQGTYGQSANFGSQAGPFQTPPATSHGNAGSPNFGGFGNGNGNGNGYGSFPASPQYHGQIQQPQPFSPYGNQGQQSGSNYY